MQLLLGLECWCTHVDPRNLLLLLDSLLWLLRSSRWIEHSRRVLEGNWSCLVLLLGLLLLLARYEGELGLRLNLDELLRLCMRW